MLDAVRRQIAASAGSKKVTRQKPLKIKRPEYLGKKAKAPRLTSVEDFVAFARRMGGPK